MTPEALAQTHAAAFTDQRPWSADEFASFLTQTGVILCGDAKSFVLGRLIADEAEVLTLATHPDFQRQGLAKAHLLAFVQAVKRQGGMRIFLEVADNNGPAKSLYSSLNFQGVGHRSNYYTRQDGTKISAEVMEYVL